VDADGLPVREFRTRPLDAGPNRFVGAIAVVLKVRGDGGGRRARADRCQDQR
jgi:hypothetical protein